MTPRIFLTAPLPGSALQRLEGEQAQARLDRFEGPGLPSPKQLLERAGGAFGLICTLADRVDEALLASGLRVVANYAVGYDNIDLQAARAHGVLVCNTPDVLTDATADLAFALLLAAARRLPEADRLLRRGEFKGWAPSLMLGRPVAGQVLGVVGAGRIGLAMLRRATGFGMQTFYTGHRERPQAEDLGARFLSLEALLERSDFVSLHCPLTAETHHLLDAKRLRMMKTGSVLINTARGAVVEEAALPQALDEGPLFALGLDVFEQEPRVHPELLLREDVVLLPHLGSATDLARSQMVELCVAAVESVLAGERPKHLVEAKGLASVC